METGFRRDMGQLVNVFKEFFSDVPLILASIGANDNRLDLEQENKLTESPETVLSEEYIRPALLRPVAVDR